MLLMINYPRAGVGDMMRCLLGPPWDGMQVHRRLTFFI